MRRPRREPEPAGRRRTSPPGRQSSVRTRVASRRSVTTTPDGSWRPSSSAGRWSSSGRTRGERASWSRSSARTASARWHPTVASLRSSRPKISTRPGLRVSVDLSAWTRIRAYGPQRFREKVEALAPDVMFANEPEWEIVGAAYGLAPTAVVKRGARGVLVLGQERVELPAPAGEVVDATGAGDALAAGYLVGGPGLAIQAAARCVAKLGAMP